MITSKRFKAISDVSVECENKPLSLITKEKYRLTKPHKQFPCMSESVQIVYKEDVGRHGIATADIAPGEIISIEDPLSWTVNVSQFDKICQNCLRQVGRTPIPCPNHEKALFCCFSCLTQYQKTFPLDDLKFVELFSSGSSESSASVMLAFRYQISNYIY